MTKFILDAMLGNLAKWLRMLGYYVIYSPESRDEELLDRALKEGFMVITKDRGLFKRALKRGAKAYLLTSKTNWEALAELSVSLGIELELNPFRTRCPKCNGELKLVPSDEFKEVLPPGVIINNKLVWMCEDCGSFYWMGSHYKSISRILSKAKAVRPVILNKLYSRVIP